MSKRVTICLDEKFHERLKARAAAQGTTVTALITEVTMRELDEDREQFLAGVDEFAEIWDYFQERFGKSARPGKSAGPTGP
ncbi:plasmid partition protein ParG [Streptomyces sp. MZ04]|uniref:plasmid partition protein ParG n=1 Tax=Streptomyces sp. MZ04 TaxID=2559236 RepID=UPI001FD7D4A1|nr:plasmid partition protein ParG [Streptomyces sp. MZ04]